MNEKEAFVLSHLGLGDNICLLGAVIYLTTIYERVLFVVKKRNETNIRLFLKDTPKVELYLVNDDYDISPAYGCSMEKFLEVTRGKKLFLSGTHIKNYHTTSLFPLCFYSDMNLDKSIFYEYFKLPKHIDSNLQNVLDLKFPIIFCHDNSSTTGFVDILGRQEINIDKNIIINACRNIYTEAHPFHKIAETYVFLPLVHYIPIIEHSDAIFITDSSFWCLSVHIKTKPNIKKVCYTRNLGINFAKTDSSYIYENL